MPQTEIFPIVITPSSSLLAFVPSLLLLRVCSAIAHPNATYNSKPQQPDHNLEQCTDKLRSELPHPSQPQKNLFHSGQPIKLHPRFVKMFLLPSKVLPGDLTIDDVLIVSFLRHHPGCPCSGRAYDYTQTRTEFDGAISGTCVVKCGGTLKFHLRGEYAEHQQRRHAKPASTRRRSTTIFNSPAPSNTEGHAHPTATEAAFPFLDGPHLRSDAASVATTRGPDYMLLNANLKFPSNSAHSRHQHCTITWLPKRCVVCHQLFAARCAPANACFPGSEAVGQLLYGRDGLVYHLCGPIHLGVFRRSE